MRFSVLGDFAMVKAGEDVTPRSAKLRCILALLTVRSGVSVSRDVIIKEIWGDRPPEHAAGAIHTYVYELRQTLGGPGGDSGILVTKPHGYSLDLSATDFDFSRFDALVAAGSAAVRTGRTAARTELEQASATLAEALALWRGEPLANVACGEQLANHVTWLQERRRQALELRLNADLRLGRGPELIGELKVLTEQHPFHEGLHANLMLALSRCGRRSEALHVFNQLRGRLSGEFGLEPGASLQRLQRSLLVGEHELDGDLVPLQLSRRKGRSRPRSTQLPPDTPDFCGRSAIVDEISGRLTGDVDSGPVVCLYGMTGIGKSALAVHIAHRLSPVFSDGVIYVDLHQARNWSTGQLSLRMLRALDVPDDDIPDAVEERVSQFRSLVLDRKVLLVLDGVKPRHAVSALLPAGCPTLMTSRWPLHGVAGARQVRLDAFSADEALALVGRIAGRGRVGQERETVHTLVEQVGALPLAVRFIGERLASSPSMTVERLRTNVTAADVSLSDLARIGFDMSARLDSTYDELDTGGRDAFDALAATGTGEFSASRAAAVLSCSPTRADITLTGLIDAGLIQSGDAGKGGDRIYVIPPLVRQYAQERLASQGKAG